MNRRTFQYIAPIIKDRQLHWLDQCEQIVTTRQVVEWRNATGRPLRCEHGAKIDLNGHKYCLKHARIYALIHVAGPEPDWAPSRIPENR